MPKKPLRFLSLNEFADQAKEAGLVRVSRPERLYSTFRVRKVRGYLPDPDVRIGPGGHSQGMDGWTQDSVTRWIENGGRKEPRAPDTRDVDADAASVPIVHPDD